MLDDKISRQTRKHDIDSARQFDSFIVTTSASAVLCCRTKTGVDAAGVSAQRSMNRTQGWPI